MTTTEVVRPRAGASHRGVRARARAEVGPGRDGRARLTSVRTQPPLGIRMSAGDVHLVGTAAGPMGGDDLGLSIRVSADTRATVRSAAATVVLPGDGRPSRQSVEVTVGPGADLRWLPEATVVAAGSDHHVDTRVDLAADADLVFLDRLVLGRSGEVGGSVCSTVRIERAGAVLVHHGLDTGRSPWSAPPVGDDARALGLVVLAGRPAHGPIPPTTDDLAVERLADDLVVAIALARDALGLERLLLRVGGRDPTRARTAADRHDHP